MKRPAAGEWADMYREQDGFAIVESVCPRCGTRATFGVPKGHVRPIRFILALVCATCGEAFYATPAQGAGPRGAA